MRAIIGTCGNCGGPVEAGGAFDAIKCLRCGAMAAGGGPVIQMQERRAKEKERPER